MATAIITLIIELIKVAMLVTNEIFEEKKRARIAQEKYELDRQALQEKIRLAVDRIRTGAASESSQAHDIEDRLDQRLNGGGKK